MVEFYENLWAKKQPPLVALRNAQLSMLRDGSKRKVADERGQNRGLATDEAYPAEEQERPPYYWSAFALSGAWE